MSFANYEVTWSYETSIEDTSPRQAAELALSVIQDGSDPAASKPRHVVMEVSLDGKPIADFEVPAALPGNGPRLTTAFEFDAFFTVLDRVRGWSVRVENPGKAPVELLLRGTTRVGSEPAVYGPTFVEATGEWHGETVTVVLTDDVNVVLL